MQLTLDPDTLQMTLSMTGEVSKVKPFNAASIATDFFGAPVGDPRIPGPFADLSRPLKAISVDPRRKP